MSHHLKGQSELHCIEDVLTDAGFRQCGNYRGHGPGAKYCERHGKLQDLNAEQFQDLGETVAVTQ